MNQFFNKIISYFLLKSCIRIWINVDGYHVQRVDVYLIILFTFVCVLGEECVLGIIPRILYKPGKHSTMELHPSPTFFFDPFILKKQNM